MSNLVIHVKSCQIMSFMSNHAIHDFSRNSVKSGGGGGRGGVKYVFLSLRQQLRCLAEGKNVFSSVLSAGAARKGLLCRWRSCRCALFRILDNSSLSGPSKQVGFAVFVLLGGETVVNAVLQVSPHCCDASPLGLSHPLRWPSEPGAVFDPRFVVMGVRLAKVLIVPRLGECLFRCDLSTQWLGAHLAVMQVVALL
jgi:hypothetical protein